MMPKGVEHDGTLRVQASLLREGDMMPKGVSTPKADVASE